jgi:putative short chain dehydrogenase
MATERARSVIMVMSPTWSRCLSCRDQRASLDRSLRKIHGWAPGEAFKRFSSGILMGRPQESHDVASLVHYLASPDSDYMTGQAILIDGGMVFR